MRYDTFSEAWVRELERCRIIGEETAPRGMPTYEQRWRQFEVGDPTTFPVQAEGRQFRDVIAVLEALSLVGQFSIPELFTDRVEKFGRFTDDSIFHGSYGARVHGRLGDLVHLMERDPDTRQAVLTIYDSRSDLGVAKRDVPCTLSLHFMQRGRELEMRATMRSNDIWLGTPYDFTQFAILQCSVAQALGLIPGKYIHTAGSLHLYESDLEKVGKIDEPLNYSTMGYPLWGVEDDIGAISKRARDIALRRVTPKTEFEEWATTLMYPKGVWYPGMS